MLKNYLTIALRNIWRNKVFSFINIAGLALGMACSLLIILWIVDEWQYDKFHQHGKQLYRVMATLRWGETFTTESSPHPLAKVLKEEVPEIMHVAQTNSSEEALLAVGEKKFKELGIHASPELFKMFTFPILKGNPETMLNSPNSVVISQSLAEKYFGNKNPLGKAIRLNNEEDYQVTAVMQDIPKNSSMQFSFVIPYTVFEKKNDWLERWGNYSVYTFIQLHPDASLGQVEAKINKLVKEKRTGEKDDFFLKPYTEIYLYSKYTDGKQDGGRIDYIQLFSVVAVVILLIACINFMNLATARATKRAKEVGVRKVVGASRQYLVSQFMGEAIVTTLLSLLLALGIIHALLPAFNILINKELSIQYTNPTFILILLNVTLVTGLIAGSYPALFLSSLRPITVLKGTLKLGSGPVIFRKSLVVFQFALSILLIIGTMVVYRQMEYIQHKNLGITRENVIYFPLEGSLYKHFDTFRQDLIQMPGIQSITTTGDNPMQIDNSSGDLDWPGRPEKGATISVLQTGYDFIQTMGITLKEGRDFSRDFGTDSSAYIINEAAARMMNMKEPLGQEISFWNGKGRIIGVMKDFHMTSLHHEIKPLILVPQLPNTWLALVRTQPGKTTEALASLQEATKKHNPNYPIAFHFLDETFENQYRSEMVVGQLANYFACMAIFISCLGLFGLAAFTAEQRTKEIGIRKVLGANVSTISLLLSKEFIKLVLLANLIAWPIAWYVTHRWLQNFAYKIPVSPWIFALAGIIALLIALATVSYQSIKAALMNPVKSLRNE